MVVVKLIGGLGNQLFQYAAGRKLSMVHDTVLKLDISAFAESYKLHKYSLWSFNIQESFASPDEIAELKGVAEGGVKRRLYSFFPLARSYFRRSTFSEPDLQPYNRNILKTPRNVYLDGYWQSEKYFAGIEDVLRRDLTFKVEQDAMSRQVAAEIEKDESVSIHIRRGDYVSDSQTNRIHGVCGKDYYERCVSLLAGQIPDPHFFVFSDEPGWARENFEIAYRCTYVSHNDASKNYEDLRLMSMCKHHIIANSSFSWWGAWLSDYPGKTVVAPRKWFARGGMDTRDLVPSSWMRV